MNNKYPLKDMSDTELDDLMFDIDNEGFWYALTQGGYISPNILLNDADRKEVEDAIFVLLKFERSLPTLS